MGKLNRNRGVDFHLRMLGIEERGDWDIVAMDNRLYVSDMIYGRPDWVLEHLKVQKYRVADYKNRELRGGDATEYEKYCVVIMAAVVGDWIYRKTGKIVPVEAQLLYADGETLLVEHSEEDYDRIAAAAPEAATALFFCGMTDTPREKVAVTDLARFMVDPTFSDTRFGRTAAQKAGTEAHASLMTMGPVFH